MQGAQRKLASDSRGCGRAYGGLILGNKGFLVESKLTSDLSILVLIGDGA